MRTVFQVVQVFAHYLTAKAVNGDINAAPLGSLAQAKYRCVSCGALSEKRNHCEASTQLHAGVRFITNDTVNLLSTLFSALLAIALCIAL